MKIIFNKETKRVPDFQNYLELVEFCKRTFQPNLEGLKFFYIDQDGDIISISSQADMEEAFQILQGSSLRLVLTQNIDMAREQLGESAVNRSEILNQSIHHSSMSGLGHHGGIGQFGNIGQIHQQNLEQMLMAQARNSSIPRLSLGGQYQNPYQLQQEQFYRTLQENSHSQLQRMNTERVESNQQNLFDPASDFDRSIDFGQELVQKNKNQILQMAQAEAKQMADANQKVKKEDKVESKESEASDLPECFKCDGKKVNTKGQMCKKCNGSGKLKQSFFDDIKQALSSEVQKFFKEELVKNKKPEADEASKVVHEGIGCSNCQVGPIVGLRYMCTVRKDYNICSGCEESLQPLPYPVIKIRQPEDAPISVVCKFQKDVGDLPLQMVDKKAAQLEPLPVEKLLNITSINQSQLINVETGAQFVINWKFENKSNCNLPEDVVLERIEGPDLGHGPIQVNCDPENQLIQLSIQCKAPVDPEFYTVVYRFKHGQDKYFGEKVRVALDVKQPQLPFAEEAKQPANQDARAAQSKKLFDDFMMKSFTNASNQNQGSNKKSPVVVKLDSNNADAHLLEKSEMMLKKLQDDGDELQSNKSFESAKEVEIVDDSNDKKEAQAHHEESKDKIVIDPFDQPDKGGDEVKVLDPAAKQDDLNKSYEELLKEKKQNAQEQMTQSDIDKISYMEKVEQPTYNQEYKQNLVNLMNMGFPDFDKNLKLLQQNFNNMDLVMIKLLDN